MSKIEEYETRREQIEDFKKELSFKLTAVQSREIGKLLRDAAMVGAAEERYRTLDFIKTDIRLNWLYDKIIADSVLKVLGYED